VLTAPGGTTAAATRPAPRKVALGAARPARRVSVSAAQLRADQRLAQLAVRRLNAIEARLRAGLTGGDVRDGSIPARALASGLTVISATPTAAPPAPSRTVLARAARTRGTVTLTPRQLQINQRIYQAAVRRANRLTARFGRGLTGDDFRPGSITAIDLGEGIR
jgi:hypothetical protein